MSTTRLTPITALLLTLPPLLWAGNAVVGRLVYDLVPPITLNFLRWVLAFVLLLPLAHWVWRRDSGLWPHWKRFAVLGLTEPIIRPADNETEFKCQVTFEGVIPTKSTALALVQELEKRLGPAALPLWGDRAVALLVALAAESGCHFLFIGIETLSRRALAEAGKAQNRVEEYHDALRLLRRHGIHVMGAFVFGFDSDDETVFSDTLEFAMRNLFQVAQFAHLVPYPGTRLYRELLEQGRVEEGFWSRPRWDARVVYKPANFSPRELADRTHAVQREFYSYPSILRRMYPHRHWSYWFAFNLLYRHSLRNGRSHDLEDRGEPRPSPARAREDGPPLRS